MTRKPATVAAKERERANHSAAGSPSRRNRMSAAPQPAAVSFIGKEIAENI
ncbi:hypothetical protein [Synergistes jonesii]|uniref:hypothetical protein n=1 Tax=Synergistes jonesii TaxID=2754 RepID=UPI00248ED98F|nr:hypothetical protein [Synergistes jonesii]